MLKALFVAITGYTVLLVGGCDNEEERAKYWFDRYVENRGPYEQRGRKAVRILRETWPAVLPLIEERFEHGDARLRRLLVGCLGWIGPKARDAVPLLIRGLNDESVDVRNASVFALRLIGPVAEETVPLLIGLFEQEEVRYNRSALTAALGFIGKNKPELVVPVLRKLLTDDETMVRINAAEGLGYLASQATTALPGLIQALRDRDHVVRLESAKALGLIGLDATDCIKALQRSAQHDEAEGVRLAAQEAIERLRGR